MAKESNKPQRKPTLDTYQNEIRKRAEELFKNRSEYNNPGDTLSDWLQAEKDIKKKYGL